MEIKNLQKLIEFMNEHKLVELEIEEEGRRVKLKKSSGEAPIIIKENSGAAGAPQSPPVSEAREEGLIEVKSPMVGTFYRAPSPGARPYAETNSEIRPGDVICIIEAMKLMNEIKSEISGTIVEIPVENGEPVEFGQTIFLVKPL